MENGLWYFFFTEDEIVWYSQPNIKKDSQNRPHSESGPAFEFLGLSDYFWHGVFISDHRIIDAPSSLTVTEIEEEKNAEVRRVMIERFGQSRFLLESGAKEIHRDDFGIIYRKEIGADIIGEPIPSMVERVKRMLAAGKTVKIFTARIHGHGMPLIGGGTEDVVTPIKKWCLKHLGQELEVTNVKDFGMVTLYDDRCIQVEKNTGRLIGSSKDRRRHIKPKTP